VSQELSLAERLKARLAHLGQDYCIFTRSGRDFAISVSAAHEVLTGEPATSVPQAPAALVGVLNFRGEVLPLVQLDTLLGMPSRPYSATDQIVVLSSEELDIGLVVDRVRDVRAIDPTEITQCPNGGPAHRLCRGDSANAMGVVSVLDAQKVITEAVQAVSLRFQQRLPTGSEDAARATGALLLSNE
jgi:purine-binding chemotaxis protein CheW